MIKNTLIFLSFSTALLACDKLNHELEQQLDESQEIWNELKADSDDTYQYTTGFKSWTGYQCTQTFGFEQGVATYRSYEVYEDAYAPDATPTESWEEEGDEVGSHEESCFETLTIDELYERCRRDVLSQSSKDNSIYLEFDDDSVLSSCEYVPIDCADDCSSGVNIRDLIVGLW